LSVVAKKDSLDPPFNDDVCPHLFHIGLPGMCPAGPPLRAGSRGTIQTETTSPGTPAL
jgi:hypothetical protein